VLILGQSGAFHQQRLSVRNKGQGLLGETVDSLPCSIDKLGSGSVGLIAVSSADAYGSRVQVGGAAMGQPTLPNPAKRRVLDCLSLIGGVGSFA
jgi:hypothetical protein